MAQRSNFGAVSWAHQHLESGQSPSDSDDAGDSENAVISRDDKPRDILVIDDDPSNLTAIEVALGEFGRRLVKARSGREALRQLLNQDFALILLDIQMPQMDGFETARLIRQRERSKHVPIIFVTAHSRDDDDVLRGYRLGAVDFLFKPIVPEVLRAKASVFVALQQRTEEVRRQAEQLRELQRREHEQRLARERRRWETQRLREESRRKDEFLAMLSHELRNPLASLMAVLEMMNDLDVVEPGFSRAHAVMGRQVNHLTRLVDDLLDISRISQGKIGLERRPCNLSEVVEQALESARPALAERDQHLEVATVDRPMLVNGDRDRLIQVISNLVNNAMRYTDPGGHIELSLKQVDNHARVRVRDDGRGIEPEVIDHIFELFAQEQVNGEGLGLGLTLVQRLVELHDGTVEVRSGGRGTGSEFDVLLPMAEPATSSSYAHEPSGEESREAVSKESREAPSKAIDKTTSQTTYVALIDDNEDVRAPLALLLGAWGYQVDTAGGGVEGVELVVESKPDVVLMDIGMPDVDGFEAAERIQERLKEAAPRLIAMTGYGSPRDRQRSRDAGFDAHLVKPAQPDKLRKLLEGESYDDGD